MAELSSPVPYQLKIPDNNSFYQPQNLPFRNWSPADFESAYQFGPKPVPIDEYSGLANSVGTIANQFTPQTQAANAQARLAGSLATGSSNALATAKQNQTTVAALNSGADPNLVDPSAGSWSVAGSTDGSAPNLTGTPSTPVSSAPVSNASATSPDGSRTGLATVFAGSDDLKAYNDAIAQGKSEQEALAVGDNGIGKWGAQTSNPNNLHVALPLSTLAAHGISEKDAPGTPVTVQYNGKSVAATVGDVLPDNAKNGAAIDLNPGVAGALDVDPNNFKGNVAFNIGAIHSADSPVAPIAGPQSDLPQNSSAPSNAPLFGFQPNVAPNGVPPSQASGAGAANSIINGPQIPVGTDVPHPRAIPNPVIVPPPQAQSPTVAPNLAPSPWQQQLTSALGSGHITVDPKGGVSYDTVAPLNALQQSEVNLAPQKMRLAQAELDQSQQKLNQERIMGPLTIQAEQAKILQAQRQFEAMQDAAKASSPTIVPPSGLPNSNTTSATTVDPTAPFSPGHILVRQFTVQPKDGAMIQGENPLAKEMLAGARLSGVPLDEHIKLLDPNTLEPSPNGVPFLDTTSTQHAMGAGTVALREQSNQFGNKYLLAQGATDAVNAYVDPKTPKNGAGDRQLVDEVLQTAAPGTKPSEGDVKALLESHGIGDMYESLKNKVFTPYDPPFLSDKKRQDLAAAANTSTQARAKEYLTFAHANTASVAQKAVDAAGGASPNAAPSGMVSMRSPSGKIGTIPANKVADATAKGFTVIQ